MYIGKDNLHFIYPLLNHHSYFQKMTEELLQLKTRERRESAPAVHSAIRNMYFKVQKKQGIIYNKNDITEHTYRNYVDELNFNPNMSNCSFYVFVAPLFLNENTFKNRTSFVTYIHYLYNIFYLWPKIIPLHSVQSRHAKRLDTHALDEEKIKPKLKCPQRDSKQRAKKAKTFLEYKQYRSHWKGPWDPGQWDLHYQVALEIHKLLFLCALRQQVIIMFQ